MFEFLKKDNRGNIEKEFGWMSLEKMESDFPKNKLTSKDVAIVLGRFAIYGGLDLKKSIDSQGLLKNSDPDRIVVESIAFTWRNIFSACLNSRNVDIYEDEDLADSIYGCTAVLHDILNEYCNFEIEKGFTSPYSKEDTIKNTEILTKRILSIGNGTSFGNVKDSVGVVMVTNIYATTLLQAIIKSSINLLHMYLKK